MSKWYAAHLVLYVRLKHGQQACFPVWENVVLVKAASEDEAFAKAEARGQEDATEDPSFRWDGRPAEWIFAGVRKLTLCQDPEHRPGDGTEVTYLEMELPSEAAVRKLASGNHLSVRLMDSFPDEEPTVLSSPNGRRKLQEQSK